MKGIAASSRPLVKPQVVKAINSNLTESEVTALKDYF